MADREVGALIVGGGAAGAACAEALHEGGFGDGVLLVGREPDPPYERPPASKAYLAGEQDRDACLFHDAAWYAKRSIELATRTSVMRMDTAARTATLSTKEVVGLRGRARRDGRQRPPPAPGRRAAAGHPLPARARQQRRDPRRRRGGRARRARRRLLHRLRGRRDAHDARAPLHDGDARGRTALRRTSARPPAPSSRACCASTASSSCAATGWSGSRARSASSAW